MRWSEVDEIRDKVRCSACQGKITGRVNLVELRRRATWAYPCAGNVITGEDHLATAICCDACIDSKAEIVEAVEFAGEQVVYHAVRDLEHVPDLPDCPTCAGCGAIANDQDRTPWKHWAELPARSRAAVAVGLVRPLQCPDCHGAGKMLRKRTV